MTTPITDAPTNNDLVRRSPVHQWEWDWPWHMVKLRDWFYMVGHSEHAFQGGWHFHVRILGLRSYWFVPKEKAGGDCPSQCGSKSPGGILTCDQPRGHDGECSEGAVNQWKPLPAPCNPVESDSMSAQAFMNATVARMERYAANAERNGRSEEARIWRCAADTVQAQFLRMTQPLT